MVNYELLNEESAILEYKRLFWNTMIIELKVININHIEKLIFRL